MEPLKRKLKLSPPNETEHSERDHQDRLSTLPDSLLVTILTLLPIQSAVLTCVLSRQWHHLWTKITNISLIFSPPSNFERFECFIPIVDHIMSQLNSSKLQCFELETPSIELIDPSKSAQLFNDLLVPRIENMCSKGLESIKLRLESARFVVPLPTCVIKTRPLVHLQLHASKFMEFNCKSIIDLPNLKKLDVVLHESQRPLMEKLFKSCPILEDLYMCLYLTKVYYDIEILAPNLNRLHIGIMKFHYGCTFVIDSPKLEYFVTHGHIASYEFIEIPSDLQEARVLIEEDCIDEFSGSYIHGLIRGISCARTLILEHKCIRMMELLDQLDEIDPKLKFHNLMNLSFMFFRNHVPNCMLGNLKMLKIWDNGPSIREIRSLEHTLSNAAVLEELHFRIDSQFIKLDDEKNFCEKLFKLPESSPCCHIVFTGPTITASSNDYQRVLSC